MRLLLVASPVAPVGHGRTGGVSRHLQALVRALGPRGHALTVLAPRDSRLEGADLIEVDGAPQPTAARAAASYPIPPDAVVAALWRTAHEEQSRFDAIVNLGHDWLPYYLTPFLDTPVVHIANLPALNPATDAEIARISRAFPHRIAMLSHAQARSYDGLGEVFRLVPGIDVDTVPVGPGGDALVFAGRITPQKGLEHAALAAERAGRVLHVAGVVEDPGYLAALCPRFPGIAHHGHLAPQGLYELLGAGLALVQTPEVDEAFGFVTIEALACGTPVVGWARGALPEIVEDGVSGVMVPVGDIEALRAAIDRAGTLDRAACRARARAFSLAAMADSFEAWLALALDNGRRHG